MPKINLRKLLVSITLPVLPFLCAGTIAAQPKTAAPAAVIPPAGSSQIPAGTILPVRLNHGFSSKNVHPGDAISGRIMQNVPLPNGGKIPEGATVSGKILSVTPAGNGTGEAISFTFNQLAFDHQKIPIAVDLRAIASFMEVNLAQVPNESLGFGTPGVWADRTQIGGDSVYGVGGDVANRENQPVGKALFDGVLVHVTSQSGSPCRGALDNDDRLQALWVFSSDACGVYGMPGVTIAHAGRSAPVGVVELAAPAGQLKVRADSGMLLRVTQ